MNKVFTKETVVANTTTETEVFNTNLGSVRQQSVVRLKLFGVVNNNANLEDNIQVGLYLNDTLVTYGLGQPDVGTPFVCVTFDLLFQNNESQQGNTVLLNGQSQNGDTDDGASHLHYNATTIDTSDESVLSIRVKLYAADTDFGVTVKSVVLEKIL